LARRQKAEKLAQVREISRTTQYVAITLARP
jgi:hypothetical protein